MQIEDIKRLRGDKMRQIKTYSLSNFSQMALNPNEHLVDSHFDPSTQSWNILVEEDSEELADRARGLLASEISV